MDFNTGLRWKVQLQSNGGPMVGEPPPRLALGLPRRVPLYRGFWGGASATAGKELLARCQFAVSHSPPPLLAGFNFGTNQSPLQLVPMCSPLNGFRLAAPTSQSEMCDAGTRIVESNSARYNEEA